MSTKISCTVQNRGTTKGDWFTFSFGQKNHHKRQINFGGSLSCQKNQNFISSLEVTVTNMNNAITRQLISL